MKMTARKKNKKKQKVDTKAQFIQITDTLFER